MVCLCCRHTLLLRLLRLNTMNIRPSLQRQSSSTLVLVVAQNQILRLRGNFKNNFCSTLTLRLIPHRFTPFILSKLWFILMCTRKICTLYISVYRCKLTELSEAAATAVQEAELCRTEMRPTRDRGCPDSAVDYSTSTLVQHE